MPGGPIAPPPCRRCGATTDFYASGLCSRCHHYAPQRVDSCRDCHAWGAARTNKWLCRACVTWRDRASRRRPCTTCGVNVYVSARRICRLCHSQARRTRVHGERFDVRRRPPPRRAAVLRRHAQEAHHRAAPSPSMPSLLPGRRGPIDPWRTASSCCSSSHGNSSETGAPSAQPRDQVLAEALDVHVTDCAARGRLGRAVHQRRALRRAAAARHARHARRCHRRQRRTGAHPVASAGAHRDRGPRRSRDARRRPHPGDRPMVRTADWPTARTDGR